MTFNRLELEILLNAVRKEREQVEQDYINSIKAELDEYKFNNDTKCLSCGVGETSKTLQAFNGIIIKLEGEIDKYRY